jgi:hypothetical protein
VVLRVASDTERAGGSRAPNGIPLAAKGTPGN